MMQGPIRRLVRERVEQRDDARLPAAWVDTDRIVRMPAGLSWLTAARPSFAHDASGSPALVMLGTEDAAALEELVALAAVAPRVYVLVPATWGKDRVDQRLLRAPRVLLRRVAEVPASAIHLASGAHLGLGRTWNLRLSPAQSEALRQVFLRLFWHEALEEAWTTGKALSWRTAGERPFDVPDDRPGSPVRLVSPDSRLQVPARGALVHQPGGTPPREAPKRLWFPPGAEHHDRLAQLVRGGCEVVWQDQDLPELVLGTTGNVALLPGQRARLQLTFTNEQAADLVRVLELPARWSFGVDLRLGEPATRAASFWLSSEGAARRLQAEQVIELPEVHAVQLRTVPETAPTTFPQPQPLALSARHRWTVVPPGVPAGTEEDLLVGRWRKLDEVWLARLARAGKELGEVETERGRIGRAFSLLVSAMLGFERTQTRLRAGIAELEQQRPSAAGPSGAPTLLQRLAQLEEQIREQQGSQAEAERKAREDEEREKQEAAWHSRVKQAQKDIPLRRDELARAEAEAATIGKELEGLGEEVKSASKEGRKNLTARKRKRLDDQTRLDKEIQRLQSEVRELEQQAEEPFEFRPPVRPAPPTPRAGNRFVPTASGPGAVLQVPEEGLPEVGTLRTHKGQRYLVIRTWEELPVGEQAAVRLSAKLVTQEQP